MLVILNPEVEAESPEYRSVLDELHRFDAIEIKTHIVQGEYRSLVEIYLIGSTAAIPVEQVAQIPGVDRVIRISEPYRVIGRHGDSSRVHGFEHNGIRFDQDSFVPFIGLCAVDTPENVEAVMRTISELGLSCTRMGAYKPRTSPYSFQGRGKDCLPYVFELAGKYGIRVVAMEVTRESHIAEISEALRDAGSPTSVMLQIGTRNTQNFELLKEAGSQRDFPVLLKEGYGITLAETLNAAEYLASAGNLQIVLCLRGVKALFAEPHRNLVDFAHVPTVHRLTRLPVCVDPSHSVGIAAVGPDGIPDIWHATAQGVIAGANMVLTDVHPEPHRALVDGPQAISLEDLPAYVEDLRLCRQAYEERRKLLKGRSGG